MAEQIGEAESLEVVAEAERRFEALVPEIARIPKGSLLNGALVSTYEFLAYAQALGARGHEPDDVGRFFDASYRAMVGRFPRWLGRFMFWLARPWFTRRLRREAAQSVANAAEGEWQFDYIEAEGPGQFGFDIKSCAVCHAFERHQAAEYVPYLCALDDTMSETMGMGLKRSGTIALGATCCDFRYEAGGVGQPLVQLKKAE